jgi:hypothetical protein
MYKQRNRHGEDGAIPFRTGRFYCVDGEWWFAIRRGPDQGPYLNKSQAKQSLVDYITDQFTFERHLQQDRLLNARAS